PAHRPPDARLRRGEGTPARGGPRRARGGGHRRALLRRARPLARRGDRLAARLARTGLEPARAPDTPPSLVRAAPWRGAGGRRVPRAHPAPRRGGGTRG